MNLDRFGHFERMIISSLAGVVLGIIFGFVFGVLIAFIARALEENGLSSEISLGFGAFLGMGFGAIVGAILGGATANAKKD